MSKFISFLKKVKIKFDDFRNYKNFKKFWKKLDKSQIKNEELIFFIENYVKSESYNFTSRFWSTRNVKHLSLLLNTKKMMNLIMRFHLIILPGLKHQTQE